MPLLLDASCHSLDGLPYMHRGVVWMLFLLCGQRGLHTMSTQKIIACAHVLFFSVKILYLSFISSVKAFCNELLYNIAAMSLIHVVYKLLQTLLPVDSGRKLPVVPLAISLVKLKFREITTSLLRKAFHCF